ncbi:MAG: S8 family serine peptidase [Lapillicoccus sp.]
MTPRPLSIFAASRTSRSRRSRRPASLRLASVAVIGLAVSSGTLAGPGAAAATPPGAPPPVTAATGPSSSHTVTLVSGDVVTLTTDAQGRTTTDVRRSPGAVGGVHTQTVGKDIYVIPDTALPLLAADRIDRALFNVTGLIAQGYDDAHVSAVPVIAQFANRSKIATDPLPGSRTTRTLESIGAGALDADKATAAAFWKALTGGSDPAKGAVVAPSPLGGGISKLWLDGVVRPALAETNAQIKAPAAWAKGATGAGVTVAILDSGIDQTHPDFAGQIAVTRSFMPDGDVLDYLGHGTHTASTIAGTGAASGGKQKAVAFGAHLAVGKVFGNDDGGHASWAIDGMEWASSVAPIVSMSLYYGVQDDGTGLMDQAVNDLSAEHGTLFVIAAGNFGAEGITSPGGADAAVTVGSVDSANHPSSFSGTGPRAGDGALKPDLVAPGENVLAARSASLSPGPPYIRESGTSMSTPQVAGTAALILQKHPTWKGPQLKAALLSGTKILAGASAYQVGAGLLDVPAATFPTIVASGPLSYGIVSFPQSASVPSSRTVTYTNLTSAAVALDLATQVTDGHGTPAPAGVFRLSATHITVPAKGVKTVSMTADARHGIAGASYTGTLNARQSGVLVAHSAVGVALESAHYALTLKATGRQGQAAHTFATVYRYGEQLASTVAVGGTTTLRVEAGTYAITTWMDVSGPGGPGTSGVAFLGSPHLVIAGDTTVTLDARAATQIEAHTPRPTDDSVPSVAWFHDSGLGGIYASFEEYYYGDHALGGFFAAPTGPVPGGRFEFRIEWRRTAPTLALSITGLYAAVLHPLAWAGTPGVDGRITTRGVYAGHGRVRDFAPLHLAGQVAIVTRDTAATPSDQASAAAAAGATMLIIVNDRPGRFWTSVDTAIPVASLTKDEGDALVAAAGDGGVPLLAVGTASPPYVYDLVDRHTGSIPADLVYAPSAADLATVEERFVSGSPGTMWHERTWCYVWVFFECSGSHEVVSVPSARTEYVSAQPGTEWWSELNMMVTGLEQINGPTMHAAGEATVRTWFGPVTRPRSGPGNYRSGSIVWLARRSGNSMYLNLAPASSGDQGVTGTVATGSVDDVAMHEQTALFVGSTLINSAPYPSLSADVPASDGPVTYRYDEVTTRPADPWVYSTRTHTTWTFRSEHVDETQAALLALLQVDYHLRTDLTGRVATGQPIPISLRVFQLTGAALAGTPEAANLSLSFDEGVSWQPVPLTRVGDTWSGTITFPRGAGPLVSLRANAKDSAGNSVTQEVTHAFGLR